MKPPAYPKYKPSGIEWLGDVPEHWEVKPCRTIVRERTAKNEGGKCEDYLSLLANVGVIPYEEKGDIGNKKPLDVSKCKIVRRGDYVINSMNYGIGSYGISPYDGVCSSVYIVLTPRNEIVESRFAFRTFENREFQTLAQSFGNGILEHRCAINWDILKGIGVAIPPLPEQRAIAAFLDRETERVDRLVAKKRELIERLKEKRTALISRTVTRGLPAEAAAKAGLLVNPPLKPSGLDWLGDVPAHWEIVPLGYLVRFSGGATPDKSNSAYWDGSVPWVSPKDMKVARIDDTEDHVSPEAIDNSTLRLISVDSVLIVVRGMILAHSFPVAVTTSPVTINQDMKAIACGKRITPHFLYWSLTGFSKVFVSFADESAHGTRKLETETLTRFPFMLLPLAEQQAISAYLDAETAKLDALVQKIETAVERLQEYRTALITAAVTGKIDVRGIKS